jgi:hypothetical protein
MIRLGMYQFSLGINNLFSEKNDPELSKYSATELENIFLSRTYYVLAL